MVKSSFMVWFRAEDWTPWRPFQLVTSWGASSAGLFSKITDTLPFYRSGIVDAFKLQEARDLERHFPTFDFSVPIGLFQP
jgi:hypothetical protein